MRKSRKLRQEFKEPRISDLIITDNVALRCHALYEFAADNFELFAEFIRDGCRRENMAVPSDDDIRTVMVSLHKVIDMTIIQSDIVAAQLRDMAADNGIVNIPMESLNLPDWPEEGE